MGLMGLFRKRQRVVRVRYAEIGHASPSMFEGGGGGYFYAWNLKREPAVGQWVWVSSDTSRGTWALVIGVDDAAPRELKGLELKSVIRLATEREVARGEARHTKQQQREQAELDAWLDMMRATAGLHTEGRVRKQVPSGFPAVPPAGGRASKKVADRYASAWWRAAQSARSDAERAEFRRLAKRWYAIRDGR